MSCGNQVGESVPLRLGVDDVRHSLCTLTLDTCGIGVHGDHILRFRANVGLDGMLALRRGDDIAIEVDGSFSNQVCLKNNPP